jgi:hypothetical protein
MTWGLDGEVGEERRNPTLQEASSSSLVKHGLHHERHAPSCNLGKSFFAPMASSISKRQTLLGKPQIALLLSEEEEEEEEVMKNLKKNTRRILCLLDY